MMPGATPSQFPSQQGEQEDRQEAEDDAQECDLRGRDVFGRPFYEDEVASTDKAEEAEGQPCGFLHGITRSG
ncbi:hypothetical protein DKP76_18020 [Falsochrobactrum shanghaiense]|uniref:Uncharacterized protein n=1 Tax=Falsochrobactrum shanghaiense TaxID=2201899 RepID=A0A316J4N5_9HYPH|nr:hypothetical protein DKP76_18020 [Falsochrobactrum shanghaiense]